MIATTRKKLFSIASAILLVITLLIVDNSHAYLPPMRSSRSTSLLHRKINWNQNNLLCTNIPSCLTLQPSSLSATTFKKPSFLGRVKRLFVPSSANSNLSSSPENAIATTQPSSILPFLWPKDQPHLIIYFSLSLIFLYFGNWLNLRVPFLLQQTIDSISSQTLPPIFSHPILSKLILPVVGFLQPFLSFLGPKAGIVCNPIAGAFALYGLTRVLSVICAECKAYFFAHVSQSVLRNFAKSIFAHFHSLDSAFHLHTPSGVISVAYVRAVRGFQTLLLELVFSIAPTFLDLVLVSGMLYKQFGWRFASVTLATFSAYLCFTIWITQWKTKLRQELVQIDNKRNGFFIDSVLNHEVVKLFSNQGKEIRRYDRYLGRIQQLSIDCTYLIAWLNIGQAALFATGLVTLLLLAYQQMTLGKMTLGDLVAVNGVFWQLATPFNNMGYTYQELRQSLVDMSYIQNILTDQQPAITDQPHAQSLDLLAPRSGPSSVEFRNVTFAYNANINSNDESENSEAVTVLRDLSFSISPGESIAIVGPSGSGKSTTLKLMTRMLDPVAGQVLVDGVNIRQVTLASLRQRLAVVPQDYSLFDESIEYNIRYGNFSASSAAVTQAVARANLNATIAKLPLGLQTKVGERGAKLSGGERQKVSIARAILRNPSLILCDEVTSSVDAFAERDIIDTLRKATNERTTVTIAHRLSSIVHCDKIIVLDKGRIVEMGRHADLLAMPEGVYRRMWETQHLIATSTSASDVSSVPNDDSNYDDNKQHSYSRGILPTLSSSTNLLDNAFYQRAEEMGNARWRQLATKTKLSNAKRDLLKNYRRVHSNDEVATLMPLLGYSRSVENDEETDVDDHDNDLDFDFDFDDTTNFESEYDRMRCPSRVNEDDFNGAEEEACYTSF